MGPELNYKEIRELKMKFLVKLLELSDYDITASVKAEDIFGSVTNAYERDTVMPRIVQELVAEEFIRPGEKEGEIRPNTTLKNKQRLILLDMLNNIVNSGGGSLGITLNVNGSIISGDLISIKQYYNGVSNLLKEKDAKNYENWDDFFREIIQTLPKNEKEFEVITFMKGFQMICLGDAKVYAGTLGIPTEKGTYWMGRIDSVDGFFFGKFSSPVK